ncbi:hypothetical protein [Streptomyces coffeae]|uniref:EF-hand domain-containing protein n=1 Tax=Streptomyces coffeae TaxID=621382 RepID=A0ABS1NLG9_9ACTN|nr:hypothetical protein [Streptomyces coffeae]MBL1100923.1 hypothetical protein [Streptomyces coffeae]
MALTYQELHHLRLGTLHMAVTDWEKMVAKLDKLANGGDGEINAADLEKKAKAASWKGVNATVTKAFTTKTADQFQDILTEARSVHTVLHDAHKKFTSHKKKLKEIVERAAKQDIHVTAQGTVKARDDAEKKPTQGEIDAIAGEIKTVLGEAAETDSTAAAALRFHAKDKYDFGSTGFKSLGEAKKVIKDSNAFVKLAETDPTKLSNKQLTQLNDLLKANQGDPVFAERVAGELGAKGMLKFWSGATNIDSWDPDGKKGGYDPAGIANKDEKDARMKLLSTMEQRLGSTLGLASRQDGESIHQWKDQMVALGGHQFADGDGKKRGYGFQLMSNLMRNGTYDKDFLTNYGNHLVAYEKKHTGDDEPSGGIASPKRHNVLPWDKHDALDQTDPLHFGDDKDAGTDPMTGFMKALSRTPDASTDFFSSHEPEDNLKWVLKDRPVLDDSIPDGGYGVVHEQKTPRPYWESTGAALAAGATGVDPGDHSAKAPPHTPEHREILDRSLDYLSAKKDDFPPEMRDDMAKVFVNHGDVFHHTASAQADHPNDPRELDRRQLLEVTKQISRDQGAYGLLNDGINHELVHDIRTDKPEDPRETLQRAGHTVGFLEEARYQALADKVAADKEDAVWQQTWGYHGAGIVSSFIPEAHLAGAADRGLYVLSQDWRMDEEKRIGEENRQQSGQTFKGREHQLESLAKIWKQQNPHEEGTVYTITGEAGNAALRGNAAAQGLPGRQPAH